MTGQTPFRLTPGLFFGISGLDFGDACAAVQIDGRRRFTRMLFVIFGTCKPFGCNFFYGEIEILRRGGPAEIFIDGERCPFSVGN